VFDHNKTSQNNQAISNGKEQAAEFKCSIFAIYSLPFEVLSLLFTPSFHPPTSGVSFLVLKPPVGRCETQAGTYRRGGLPKHPGSELRGSSGQSFQLS
jgi:hypothetical protein